MESQRFGKDVTASPAPGLVASTGPVPRIQPIAAVSRQFRDEHRVEKFRDPDDAYAQPPVQDLDKALIAHAITREDEYAAVVSAVPADSAVAHGKASHQQQQQQQVRASSHVSREELRLFRRQSHHRPVDHDLSDVSSNLYELSISPVRRSPDETLSYEHYSPEETRSRDSRRLQDVEAQHQRKPSGPAVSSAVPKEVQKTGEQDDGSQPSISRLTTQIYTTCYLILFSILGTLARLGLQAITDYVGAPTTFSSIWPNFAGCIVMGFLAEDRMLFLFEWGRPTYEDLIQTARRASNEDTGPGSGSGGTAIDLAAAKKVYMATKKTIPLYIGLATGFCGSFTSFSAFIRDMFLALSNNMPGYDSSRNGGYSFMATVAVMILTVSLSLSGLFVGTHLAIALEPVTPSLPFSFTRKILDRLAVLLACGCWLGAIFMSIFPPDRNRSDPEIWRGRAVFSLVFAPLGCLGRFYASLYLNSRIASFPLGTFVVNVFGSSILGMSWDLAHVPLGGVVGCQVLQGVEDGFCGCLTTVSAWVVELSSLKRLHAYLYGATSILVSLSAVAAIMGGLGWSDGFAPLQCIH